MIDALILSLIEIEGIEDLLGNLLVRKFLQQGTTLITNLLHTWLIFLLMKSLIGLIDKLVRHWQKRWTFSDLLDKLRKGLGTKIGPQHVTKHKNSR